MTERSRFYFASGVHAVCDGEDIANGKGIGIGDRAAIFLPFFVISIVFRL